MSIFSITSLLQKKEKSVFFLWFQHLVLTRSVLVKDLKADFEY